MTTIAASAELARETARTQTGKFGAQEHAAPELSLDSTSAPADAWGAAFNAAEDQLDEISVLVAQRVRDSILMIRPGAAKVAFGLNEEDTDGGVIISVYDVDGVDIDPEEDDVFERVVDELRGYGYNRKRIHEMPGMAPDANGDYVFALADVSGDALGTPEMEARTQHAWGEWEATAQLLPAALNDAMKRAGTESLDFEYQDVDDHHRATCTNLDVDSPERAEVEAMVNSYIDERSDFATLPGFMMSESDEYAWEYRA